MKEEDHFTQTQLSLLSHTAAHGSKATTLGSHSSFSLPLFFSHSLTHFALQVMPLFIGFNGTSSYSFVKNDGHLTFTYFVTFDCCTSNPF